MLLETPLAGLVCRVVPRVALALGLLLSGLACRAESPAMPIEGPFEETLILISFDGFRADYLDLVETPNLDRLIEAGTRAEGLIPVFPSSTFPSHYTIVTGLYPGNHGIVFNDMRDPELGEFRHRTSQTSSPSWWGGEPIWVTAERQGVTAATMFWPGSDIEIGGRRPTYWRAFDGRFPYEARVSQVLEWLDLPAAERPRMITLYFQDPNRTSHRHGPEAPETFAAVREVDARLGDLLSGLEARGVADRANLVIVSDHGMAEVGPERVIVLDDYVELSREEVFQQGSLLQIYPAEGREASIYQALKGAHPNLTVYRKEELPERYHLGDGPRLPPILGVPDATWEVMTAGLFQRFRTHFLKGDHGQDPDNPLMHGLFVASGPAFRSGLVVEHFESVEVYNLLAAVLGIEPAVNDGDLESMRHLLRPEPVEAEPLP